MPTGLQGEDNCYAVVPPYGPRSGHWAKNAQGDGEGGDDVWAAERVLPHGTVQNLSKWSMYKEDGLEGYTPTPQTADGMPQDTDWTPNRERVPGQSWYDKVTSSLNSQIYSYISVKAKVTKFWGKALYKFARGQLINKSLISLH